MRAGLFLTVLVYSLTAAAGDIGGTKAYLLVPDLVQVKSPAFQQKIFKENAAKSNIEIAASVDADLNVNTNEDESFIPASVVKVVTSALGFERLGPDYRFKTILNWRESADKKVIGGVKVHGFGDPTLGFESFDQNPRARLRDWITFLKNQGYEKIEGPIELRPEIEVEYEASYLRGLTSLDRISCYGTVVGAFNFHGNCGTLVISGLNQAGWVERDLSFPLKFAMTPGEVTRVLIDANLDADGKTRGFRVYGTWKTDDKSVVSVKLPVADSETWLKRVLATELRKSGLKWNPQSSVDPAAFPTGQGYTIWSPTLEELIVPQNKRSLNFLSEALYFQAGARSVLQDELQDWAFEAKDSSLAEQIQLYDGSGLSRQNQVTASALLKLLKVFTRKRYFGQLLDSLPIAGVDGTLGGRFVGTRAAGHVRAKTGTMAGSYQLAGYIPRINDRGEELEYVPFVILTSASRAQMNRVRREQDKMVLKIFDLINPPSPNTKNVTFRSSEF